MSSNRIQDWIRYVNDKTETAPAEKGAAPRGPETPRIPIGTGEGKTEPKSSAEPKSSEPQFSAQERLQRERRAREYLATARAIDSRHGESIVGGPSAYPAPESSAADESHRAAESSLQHQPLSRSSGVTGSSGVPGSAGAPFEDFEALGQGRHPGNEVDAHEVDAHEDAFVGNDISAEMEDEAFEATPDAPGAPGAAKRVQKRVRSRPETRAQLLDRLLNPTISLHEASIILDVCTATVRRYTDSGLLPHLRTEGGQRRFRLRDVLILSREINKKGKA